MPRPKKQKNSFKRRPNNSGTVTKLSGNRRAPFVAKVTTGYDQLTGRQIQKAIGYFETREDAIDALTIYKLSNSNMPKEALKQMGGTIYDEVMKQRNKDVPTFDKLYDQVFYKSGKYTDKRIGAYNSAYKWLAPIQDKKINDIRLDEMQQCIDDAQIKLNSVYVGMLKTICTKIFKYAVMNRIIDRNDDYSSFLTFRRGSEKSDKHQPFTDDEIRILFEDNSHEAQETLILIFTGLRPNEMLGCKLENIFFNEDGIDYMITGSKTDAGKDRVIPIHPKIINFLKAMIKRSKGDVLYPNNTKDVLRAYRMHRFDKLMDRLEMKHTPYDARHTFATIAKSAGMDEFSRQRIMGHKSDSITDDVYTHTDKQKLYNEMLKINKYNDF